MKARGKIKDKRSAILNAALTMVTQNGLQGISMKLIAAEADVAAGTIYIHFENKEEMLASLYLKITDEINHLVARCYQPENSFKSNFIVIWSEILKVYIADQRIPDFVSQYAFSANDTTADNRQLLSPIYKLFERAQKEHVIKNIPIHGLVALAHGPITSLVRMARSTKFQIASIDIDVYAKACWDAIKNNS